MQFLKDFDTIIQYLAAAEPRARVAVACPHDEHTCEAIAMALDASIARFILVGDPAKIPFEASAQVEIIAEPDPDAAAARAVALARAGEADVVMKGLINTDNMLRAVLNKEHGILPAGHVLTHITAADIPGHDGLLFFSDAAVIPFPTQPQLEAMTGYLADVIRKTGIAEPRIALIHCTEKSSPKFPVTEAYAAVKAAAAEGAFGEVIVDGPMDLKTAVDPESGIIKGINSPIEGKANALIFPDIEAGNVFYKTLTWLTHCDNAGMLAGAAVPVVLPSRADTSRSKLCSLALAACSALL